MSRTRRAPEKIADPELRHLAEAGGAGEASVLVELALSRPRVSFAPRGVSSVGAQRPVEVVAADPDAQRADAQVRAEVERRLAALGCPAPAWLPAARALALCVNGEQLRALVAWSEVKAVLPNRRLVPPRSI